MYGHRVLLFPSMAVADETGYTCKGTSNGNN